MTWLAPRIATFLRGTCGGVVPVSSWLFDGAAPLRVDTVGGGTWVAEYAVFHGVSPTAHGRDHLRVLTLGSRYGLRGRLAPMLERAGYRSVAILPFAGDLLGGDAMYRSLGLRRVVDCRDVPGAEAFGEADLAQPRTRTFFTTCTTPAAAAWPTASCVGIRASPRRTSPTSTRCCSARPASPPRGSTASSR
jgi:hypothetical protein